MQEASEPETLGNTELSGIDHYWSRGWDGLTDKGNKLNIAGSKPLNTFQRSF